MKLTKYKWYRAIDVRVSNLWRKMTGNPLRKTYLTSKTSISNELGKAKER